MPADLGRSDALNWIWIFNCYVAGLKEGKNVIDNVANLSAEFENDAWMLYADRLKVQ